MSNTDQKQLSGLHCVGSLWKCALLFVLSSSVFTPPLVADEIDRKEVGEKENIKGEKQNARLYSLRQLHDPNGTGKFYMGREIAQVMSFHGAPWLNRPQREQEEQLSKLIELLDIQPGSHIADIGAGSGVLTELLARQTGSEGTVYAVDIQDEMLKLLEERMKVSGLTNVEPVLGKVTDPRLDEKTVDLMILVDVYHEFSHPHEMCMGMSKALRPGGRIVLVEYRKEDPRIPIKEIHKMTQSQAKKELLRPEFGLKWKETFDDLPRQHVIVFEKQIATDEGTSGSND